MYLSKRVSTNAQPELMLVWAWPLCEGSSWTCWLPEIATELTTHIEGSYQQFSGSHRSMASNTSDADPGLECGRVVALQHTSTATALTQTAHRHDIRSAHRERECL
jgi:hypothetical protein